MGWREIARCAALASLLVVGSASAATREQPGWTSYGNGGERWGETAEGGPTLDRRFVLPLNGRITGQVLAANGNFFAATSAGEVVAFNPDGYLLWRVEVGQLANSCRQLDGYGVTGTGVIDASTQTLYVADTFGRVHALDLATGAERTGWPVRVFADDRRELVWGALSLVDGAVYVPTASYCDSPTLAGVYRVDLATQQVGRWISVPASLGGGGGIWGWGGLAYSPIEDDLYAVTANALAGGDNSGDAFSEAAAYGEHLVQLDASLDVESADHPGDLTQPEDLDFVGSPLVIDRSDCGELVIGADKDDDVYAWRADDIAAGPIWELPLEQFDPENALLSQLAWSPSLTSLYAVTGTQLVRVSIGADCSEQVVWQRPLGTHTENGSPTIAGDEVWFAVNGRSHLLGYDARTGDQVDDVPLGGATFAAPTVLGDRLVVGTFTGLVEGFTFSDPSLPLVDPPPPAGLAADASWAGKRYGWQSRDNGVYATDDGGRSWHVVFPAPAERVLRLSRTSGVIEIGLDPGGCMCAIRKLWTNDAGRSWHETLALGDDLTAGGGELYWWKGGSLNIASFAPASSKRIASIADGTIVAAAPIAGGIAALVSSRVRGQGWDASPRVLLVRGTTVQTLQLPAASRTRVLGQELRAAGSRLTVTGTDFVAQPPVQVTWSSTDGGATWTVA
jgi:hypothetical protein